MGERQRDIAEAARGDEWLVGGGELGARIRAHDWATTPLGPRDRWPAELRAAVRRLVGCPLDAATPPADEEATHRALEHHRIADLLGVVAHDLRSPLHAIALQAALLRPVRGQPERRKRRPVEAIDRNIARMNRLIEDLLDLARLDAGPLPIARERVPVGELLVEAVELHQDAAAAAATTLRWQSEPGLPDVWVDRGRMLQVLDNLISNALRFAPGGTVAVGARAGARADEVDLEVVDDGAGIEPADLPRLFDRFWRATSSSGHGVGLGLAIVKGIVEAHGGRVWVESAPGAGSAFRFTAPVAVPPSARST